MSEAVAGFLGVKFQFTPVYNFSVMAIAYITLR